MLQDSFRKHRKWWLAGLILLVVPSFVLAFGSFDSLSRTPSDGEIVIGYVNDLGVTADELRVAVQQELRRREQMGQPAELENLATSGALEQIRLQLIQDKLVELEIQKAALSFDREYLADKLKQMPQFQTEAGTLDYEMWNRWVQSEDVNWNELYQNQADQLKRQVFSHQLLAPARVLDRDLREQFEQENTQISVKYLEVDLLVEVTEEQIVQQYEENPEIYQNPAERVVEFVMFSMVPPMPDVAQEIVERARGGEDFGELAKEFSEGPDAETGGDYGWVTIDDTLRPPRDVVRGLGVGEVSDVIAFGRGYYIYKVEEERGGEGDAPLEKRIRQIQFFPQLDDETRSAVEGQAEAFAQAAAAADGLEAVAEEEGLEVLRSGAFSNVSTEIANVPAGDLFAFRSGFAQLGQGEVSGVVTGGRNLYVGRVDEVKDPTPKPLDEVRDQVRQNIMNRLKSEPDYQQRVADIAERIKVECDSLEEIRQKFEELSDAEVQTAPPFTIRDWNYSGGLFWRPEVVYEAVKDKEPGEIAGPIQDLIGKTYFLELVEFVPPSEMIWEEEWPQEKERMRQQALQVAQNRLASDYIQYLEDEALRKGDVNITLTGSAIIRALGLDTTQPAAGQPAAPVGEDVIPLNLGDETADDVAAPEQGDTPAGETAPPQAEPAAEEEALVE